MGRWKTRLRAPATCIFSRKNQIPNLVSLNSLCHVYPLGIRCCTCRGREGAAVPSVSAALSPGPISRRDTVLHGPLSLQRQGEGGCVHDVHPGYKMDCTTNPPLPYIPPSPLTSRKNTTAKITSGMSVAHARSKSSIFSSNV